MIATIKETWTSIRNLNYGQQIVQKTVGQTFWYWFKYVLAVSIIIVFLVLGTLVYFIPQLPQLAEKNLPDIKATIKDGKLTTNAPQPLVVGDETFKLIVNTNGKDSDIDQILSEVGVLVLEDKMIMKDSTQVKVTSFSDFKDVVTFDKPVIVDWLKNNKLLLLTLGLVIALVAGLFLLGFFVIWKWIEFLIGGLVLLLVAKILKKSIAFVDSLKIVLYAAVPSLIVSLLFSLIAPDASSVVSFLVWTFFAVAWVYKLPVAKQK